MTRSSEPCLKTAKAIDLAKAELDYEGFRALAQNQHLSVHEKVGFPDAYRAGFETDIFDDICAKLPVLRQAEGRRIVDIGPGCGALPRLLIDLCKARGHTLVLADSPEMLGLLPAEDHSVRHCAGAFPKNASDILTAAGGPVDAIVCYSVLHYLYVDSNLFDVIDETIGLLASGGRALFGDIPNLSKRRRFFATERGQAFHRAFTGSDAPYVLPEQGPVKGKIDDAVLSGLIQRAQGGGADAYLLPQPDRLPMANRRDDVLIVRP